MKFDSVVFLPPAHRRPAHRRPAHRPTLRLSVSVFLSPSPPDDFIASKCGAIRLFPPFLHADC